MLRVKILKISIFISAKKLYTILRKKRDFQSLQNVKKKSYKINYICV
jgi:hypothetical protein